MPPGVSLDSRTSSHPNCTRLAGPALSSRAQLVNRLLRQFAKPRELRSLPLSLLRPSAVESPVQAGAADRAGQGRPKKSSLGTFSTLLWRLATGLLIFLAVAEGGLRLADLGHAYESEPESYLPSR